MRALRLWSPEILRWRTKLRARSLELAARSRPGIPIITISRREARTRVLLRRTLIHPIPCGSGTTVGTGAVKARTLRRRRHRRAHFIFTTAEIPRVVAARRKAVVIHDAALLPVHPVGTLRHACIAVALLHPPWARVHSRFPALPVKARTLPAVTTILRRAIGAVAAIFGFLIVRTLGLRALISPAKLPVARTRVALP